MLVGVIVGVRISRGFVQTVVGVVMGVEPSLDLFSPLARSEYKRQGGTTGGERHKFITGASTVDQGQ